MSTYYSIHLHVVFSTKHRRPFITADWIDRLHAYLGGILTGLDVVPVQISGVADHVHLLLGIKTTHRVSDVIRDLKKSSTAWVHEEIGLATFSWQDGYAAISVSPNACDQVKRYIANQAEHHRTRTFREELEDILRRAGISFQPEHLD